MEPSRIRFGNLDNTNRKIRRTAADPLQTIRVENASFGHTNRRCGPQDQPNSLGRYLMQAKLLGNQGERMTARFLRRQGLKILARQYRMKLGEIDLVCREGETIVFVEVKTRRSVVAGRPDEAVTLAKQTKLTQIAFAYLKQYGLLEHRARFDVISTVWPAGNKTPEIKHYRNAFSAIGFGQMFS